MDQKQARIRYQGIAIKYNNLVGMMAVDFDEEITKHLQWRAMVEALFQNRVETNVPPSLLIQDNKCQLGKWIYSEESNQYSFSTAFTQLIEYHKNFHIKAGTILSLYQQGKKQEAESLAVEFYDLSGKVIKALESLKAYNR